MRRGIGKCSSFEQVGMRAGSDEGHRLVVDGVDQEPVGLDVALAIAAPVPVQGMVSLIYHERFAVSQGGGSEHLDRQCHRLAAADAQGGDAAAALAPPQRVQKRHQDPRAAGADRMTERDCATMNVHILG